MFRHILLPTDGSEISRETSRQAVALAKSVGARITAIYVKHNLSTDHEGDLIDPSAVDRIGHAAEKKAKEYLGLVKKLCKEAGVECRTIAACGDHPYKEIIATATTDKCDLIFMASHGRRGLSSLLLGSETQKVLTHTSVPVLVYRPPHLDKYRPKNRP
jgi:nucleotide-binding universal stress UspA family protein